MALTEILRRRIKASKTDVEVEDLSSPSPIAESDDSLSDDDDNGSTTSNDSDIGNAAGSNREATAEEEDDLASLSPPSSPHRPFTTVSFGALASAQASLGKRKRSPNSSSHPSKRRSISPFAEAAERLAGKKDHRLHSRTSKHAPTELSSKKAVSRKRAVVPTPIIQHRDPRFEPLSGALDTAKLADNYKFLNDYRASEIAALKTQVRSTKDPAAKEDLKRQLLSMESREKARKAKEIEQGVLREYRRKEKEAVEKGKKPFYLKKGEQKKLALVKRFEGMGEKKVERVIERRRKKKAGKEKKAMPRGRRALDG